MPYALQQVQARVNQVTGDLPAGLDIQIERLTPSLFPVLSYNLEGGDPATLYDIAQYQIRPVFSRMPGVGPRGRAGRATSASSRSSSIRRGWPRWGSRTTQLAEAIRRSSTVSAVGRVARELPAVPRGDRPPRRTRRRTWNASWSAAASACGDVASVVLGTEDHVRIIAGDGRPAALLNVTRQLGGNTVAIADSVAAHRRVAAADAPPGVRLNARVRPGGARARRGAVGARRHAHRRRCSP